MCLGSSHAHGKNQWSLVSNSWNNAPKASVTWSSDTQREEKSQSLKSDTIYNAVYTDTQGERHLKNFFILWYTEPWYTGGREQSQSVPADTIYTDTHYGRDTQKFFILCYTEPWYTGGREQSQSVPADTIYTDTHYGRDTQKWFILWYKELWYTGGRAKGVQKRAEARRGVQRRAEACRCAHIHYTVYTERKMEPPVIG